MNKKCARCDKTVYPIEELKCLDKVWHKQCFKCQSCGMTLNMRNYKGFNKNPYCEAHVPKAQATTMADTPELKRIQENTKLQSNVTYHAEFEKAKGKFTQVADDPEIKRIKQNSKIISNVAYHGDLERKAVMEQKRVLTGDGIAEDGARQDEMVPYAQYSQPAVPPTQMPPPQQMPPPSHPPQHQPPQHQLPQHQLPQHQPPQHQPPQHQLPQHQLPQHQPPQHQPPQHQPPQHQPPQHQPPQHQPPQHQPPQHQPPQHQPPQHQPPQHQPPQHQPSQHQPPQHQLPQHHPPQHSQMHPQPAQHYSHNQHHSQPPVQSTNFAQPGKIADYDPLNNATRNSPYSARQSSTLIYTSGRGPVSNQPGRRIGSIADLDPVNDFYGSLSTDYRPPSNNNVNHNNNHQTQQYHPPPPRSGRVYRAMYDYVAQDRDEVSFCDGDIIVNCTPIDDGWMTGVVQRTGQSGMLPANYVEPAL